MDFELHTLHEEEVLFKRHLFQLNQELESLNVSFDIGMPPVSSQDVVGRCLGNFIGTLSVGCIKSLDHLSLVKKL
jgi:hypothetical protein